MRAARMRSFWDRRAPRGQAAPAWRGSAVDLAELEGAAADGGMTSSGWWAPDRSTAAC